MVLLSLSNLPVFWTSLFPGAEEAPDWVIYSGYVLLALGLIASYGLWTLKRWSYRGSLVVAALNFLLAVPGLFEAPGVGLRVTIGVSALVALAIIALVLRPEARQALTAA
jgi:uncharacterized membrane protein (DUF2068 family)